jgi:cyclophilin family peptidyl-prolyl cis-trans isomerase
MKRFLFALLVAGFAFTPGLRADDPIVLMKTSMGDIKIQLYEDKAPGTVKNFLKYVEDKHYDGTIFHRVIEGFMDQGGGFTKDVYTATTREQLKKAEKETRAAIKNESSNGISNARGTIAMARTAVADSATSQFFINAKDNTGLDKAKAGDRVGYCVFGKVIDGMDVVDKINKVKTATVAGLDDVPEKPVIIESVRKVNK